MAERTQHAALEIVARRYAATGSKARGPAGGYLKITDRWIAVDVLATHSRARVAEPRLRFDRVAVGLVAGLQKTVSRVVPEGRTVVVTLTAPIRQDSRTAAILEEKLKELIATRRASLRTRVHGNRVEIRVLPGGAPRTRKVIGFVHNPTPAPAILFDVTRSLLAIIGSRKRGSTGERWLVIDDSEGLAPLKTYQHVCGALRGSGIFKRILVTQPGGRVATWRLSARGSSGGTRRESARRADGTRR